MERASTKKQGKARKKPQCPRLCLKATLKSGGGTRPQKRTQKEEGGKKLQKRLRFCPVSITLTNENGEGLREGG